MTTGKIFGAVMAGLLLALPGSAWSATEIQFWHAFTGRLGELVAEQVKNL